MNVSQEKKVEARVPLVSLHYREDLVVNMTLLQDIIKSSLYSREKKHAPTNILYMTNMTLAKT